MPTWNIEDFEPLARRFFGRGFASMTKTELEVYLFDAYMRGVEREGPSQRTRPCARSSRLAVTPAHTSAS